MKKFTILIWSLLLSIINYSSAFDLSWNVDAVSQTLQWYIDIIWKPFVFLWDLITWFYYWFNTIIDYLRTVYNSITWLSFFSDNLSNMNYLTWLLGFEYSSIFFTIFTLILFLCLVRFIYSLIPFFHSK